ncbi:MAG: putative DNA binding domain-containing protein [Christensenellaceae bacterium]|jgi:ATP-dependent DNA helicase RecG|nr:putative DNA binding domain-containing protein [Christensenellaceae bacterium]
MQYVENETLELKEEFDDKLVNSVIAFANSKGGRILIGFKSCGELIGLSDCKDVIFRVIKACRLFIEPDIIKFIKITENTMDNKKFVCIEIFKNAEGYPYYLKNEGLKIGGVFIRCGCNTTPVQSQLLNSMKMVAYGNCYSEMLCYRDDLTFKEANKKLKNKLFSKKDFRMDLGMQNTSDQYTNLGLLFSDQCEHSIKIVFFQGKTKDIIITTKECTGSILKQLDDAYEFIMKCNRLHAEIVDFYRIDRYDYPEEALREVILNAIIHRNYAFNSSTFVNLYADHLEVLSFGGLMHGTDVIDIKRGIRRPRNKQLADAFCKLGITNDNGSGIPTIMKSYADYKNKPKICVSLNTFTIEFPNRNYKFKAWHKIPREYYNIL